MSDHIPDATKMIQYTPIIQDTPRTDAEEYESQDEPITKLGSVDAEFARTLERHLNAANELIVRLQAVTNDPYALWVNWLRGSVALPVGIGDVREYQERIKRLEEAGDALCENSNPSRWDSPADAARKLTEQSNWNKAKEAKP
jgi:hypothetical protein